MVLTVRMVHLDRLDRLDNLAKVKDTLRILSRRCFLPF